MVKRGFEKLRVFFKVESDIKALDQVLSYFEQLHQPWIPKKDWLQCQLALAEGFTNAVRHAHKGLAAETPVEIQITLTHRGMKIRIWDYGNPFDLERFLQDNLDKDNRWAGHGQGLLILKRIAPKLRYIRTHDHRNCLLIFKQFSQEIENYNYE